MHYAFRLIFRRQIDNVGQMVSQYRYDVAIVGAGPAGLSAALYAARFCRSTLILHNSETRASRIPKAYNVPGFDTGIAGSELLDHMTRHAQTYGAQLIDTTIVSATRSGEFFELKGEDGITWISRSVILATGLYLNQIALDFEMHEAAIEAGILRYCPVCDGYEHLGQRIGVVGCDISGAGEALFLRQFSDDITLLPKCEPDLTPAERTDLMAAGIKTITQPITRYCPTPNSFKIFVEGNDTPLEFDVVYPALGVRPRNALADNLGLAINDNGKVDEGSIFQTPIKGLYCVGDLVEGLDQISVAMGHGAIAATKAHNWLREQDGQTVKAVFD